MSAPVKFTMTRVPDETFQHLDNPFNYRVVFRVTEAHTDVNLLMVEMGICTFVLVLDIENRLKEAAEIILV